jgi:hypothetical protein
MVDQDEKQRVFQASLEYWKATYEYFKTFATICLASIAAFSALLAGVFAEPPKNVANSMFSLIRCLVPKILSWSADHRWISMAIFFIAFTLVVFYWFDWLFEKHPWTLSIPILLFVAFTLAWFYWLVGTHIPCLSQGTLNWFGEKRSIWMTIPFFAFTAAGYFSLSGTHYCRKALWDSTVSDESEFRGRGRYKRLIVLRALVWLSYGSATIDFFIIAPLSIPL